MLSSVDKCTNRDWGLFAVQSSCHGDEISPYLVLLRLVAWIGTHFAGLGSRACERRMSVFSEQSVLIGWYRHDPLILLS